MSGQLQDTPHKLSHFPPHESRSDTWHTSCIVSLTVFGGMDGQDRSYPRQALAVRNRHKTARKATLWLLCSLGSSPCRVFYGLSVENFFTTCLPTSNKISRPE